MSTVTNAHTHLELGWLADQCPRVSGRSFIPWIKDVVERRWALGDQWERTYDAAIERGIAELIAAGTTHVGDISLTGRSIGPLLESGLQGVVYVEVLGLDERRLDENLARARAIVDQWRSKERNGMQVGLTIHSPYAVHPALWKKALDYARKEALPLCIHVAESPAEFDFLLYDTGPMVDEYYLSLNMRPIPSPLKTPIAYLEDLGALALKPLLVHAVHVTEADILTIAAYECAVVHCPRSNLRLRCGRMPLEAFLIADVPVYLGTDSRASAPSLDVRDEAEVAVALHHGRVAPEVIESLVRRSWPPSEEAEPDLGT